MSRAPQLPEPHTRNDPVLALIAHYYFPCELMHERLHEVADVFFETGEHDKEFNAYLSYWLASLWVVAHAFQHVLKLEDDVLNDLIEKNFKVLSDFRNSTYHYQRSRDKSTAFFTGTAENLNWAETLFDELGRYFREYVTAIGKRWRRSQRSRRAR